MKLLQSSSRLLILGLLLLLLIRGTAAAESDTEKWRQFEGTTLHVISANFTYLEGLEQLLPEFEALTGIRVQLDLFNETLALQKIRAELASGSGAYDIIWSHANWTVPHADSGWLTPLSGFMANDAITFTDELDMDDFIESTVNLFTFDDEIYGLPWFAATIITYYRSDILAEHGISPSQLNTIEGFYEAAKAVHSSDIAGVAMRGDPNDATWHWTVFLRGLGGRYLEDEEAGNYQPVLYSEEAVRAVEIYADLLRNYSIPGAAIANYDQVVLAMQQGRAAIAIEGAPLAGRILDSTASRVVGDVGFTGVPAGPAGRFPAFTGHGWSIPSASRNKEAAWLFVQWATSADTQKNVALNSQHIAVTRESVWNDPEFRERWNLPGEGDFLKTFEESLAVAIPNYRPRIEGWPEVDKAVGEAINRVIVGTATADEAMQWAQQEAERILSRLGYLQ